MKKEIEKKFVIKRLPMLTSTYSDIQNINQYYYFEDNIWKRIRKIECNKGVSYLHTIKNYIDGVTYENECDYTFEQYKELVTNIHLGKYESTEIFKTRYIWNTGILASFDGEFKEIKWEIDIFNFNLIIAELEIPYDEFKFEIPDFIKKEIICDVTDIKKFSNRSLSEPLKK